MSETELKPSPPELSVADLDPYAPEGTFGRWIEGVTPADPKVDATSDIALREQLIADLNRKDAPQNETAVAIFALRALTLQEHNNGRRPGYTTARRELENMVRGPGASMSYHRASVRATYGDDASLDNRLVHHERPVSNRQRPRPSRSASR